MVPRAMLGLGTVQFGRPYGITRRGDAPDEAEVHAVLADAAEAGLRLLDTAAAYGTAEQRIGRFLTDRPDRDTWRIVTKLPPDDTSADTPAALAQAHTDLGVATFYGVLCHRAETLLAADGQAVWRALSQARDAGQVHRLGVSVYTPDELEAVRAHYPVDLVQLPFNLYDRRFARAIAELEAAGVEVHLRSAFLQGVLLQPAERLPGFLTDMAPAHRRFHDLTAEHGVSAQAAALSVCLRSGASRVLVGCQNRGEFVQILSAADIVSALPSDLAEQLQDPAWAQPLGLVDPRYWLT